MILGGPKASRRRCTCTLARGCVTNFLCTLCPLPFPPFYSSPSPLLSPSREGSRHIQGTCTWKLHPGLTYIRARPGLSPLLTAIQNSSSHYCLMPSHSLMGGWLPSISPTFSDANLLSGWADLLTGFISERMLVSTPSFSAGPSHSHKTSQHFCFDQEADIKMGFPQSGSIIYFWNFRIDSIINYNTLKSVIFLEKF